MKFKHIHFIINPASAKAEPILSFINKTFIDTNIQWDVTVTHKNRGADEIARGLIGKTDVIAVYGGDGCVTAVASVLHGDKLPMAIIPGGTANVMAKELGIPLDTTKALQVLKHGGHKLKQIDMGLANGEPFLLRVNLGIMAAMVTEADRELKDKIGQLAYGVTAIQTLAAAKPVDYLLKIDGHRVEARGVALTVTNSGNIGIGELELLPGISISDGLLDVILMKDNDWRTVIKVAGSALLQKNSDALQHWRCRKISIAMAKEQEYICDDAEHSAKKINIEVVKGAIRLLVPAPSK